MLNLFGRKDAIGKHFNGHNNGFKTLEIRDIEGSIKTFFKDKSWYCGGPIPQNLLYTERNFRLIENVDLNQSVELGYKSICRAKSLAKTKYCKKCEVDICLKVIRDCEKKHIPQDHIGGLFLLYLELCEKVELL